MGVTHISPLLFCMLCDLPRTLSATVLTINLEHCIIQTSAETWCFVSMQCILYTVSYICVNNWWLLQVVFLWSWLTVAQMLTSVVDAGLRRTLHYADVFRCNRLTAAPLQLYWPQPPAWLPVWRNMLLSQVCFTFLITIVAGLVQ